MVNNLSYILLFVAVIFRNFVSNKYNHSDISTLSNNLIQSNFYIVKYHLQEVLSL